METWKKNLIFCWIAQFFSITGFSFALPFAPFYLQELGITGDAEIRIWTGVFQSAAGLSMAFMTPFWGYLADRFGKKPMTLRASLGGTVVLFGMGLATSPEMLVGFRIMQGMFTGTITAYQTLVASSTPKERLGFALGLMNSSVFFGNSVSPLFGGVFADLFGYRASFFVAAILLFFSFLTSFLFIRENFIPEPNTTFSFFSDLKRLFAIIGVSQIIGMVFLYAFSRTLQRPVLPLLVQDIVPTSTTVATQTGFVSSAAGVATVLAGILIGMLADRGKTLKIAIRCALTGSLLIGSFVWVQSVWQLAFLNFLFAFFVGGMDPILRIIMARIVPTEKRGAAFGLIGSARAFGWFGGALSGGVLAAIFGLRSVFVVIAALFLVMAGLLMKLGQGKDY